MGRIAWSLDAFIFPGTHCGSTYASMDALGRISKKIPDFWNFRNSDKIYINCKMYLLLQFSFNRFEILQGYSTGYEHYGLCFFSHIVRKHNGAFAITWCPLVIYLFIYMFSV